MNNSKTYDAIVVGGGHAGAEAAVALAHLGCKTLMLSLSLDAISFMACNPNVGGTAKGHIVKEIDALGGVMGCWADGATIQSRMLNLGNGPAVHSLRAQVDKALYHRLAKGYLEHTKNLSIIQGEAKELIVENGEVKGIVTELGDKYFAGAVVLATGVYLDARIIIGNYTRETGPNGFMRSYGLTDSLIKLGIDIRRFKTGTPPRVLGSSVDLSVMEPQCGDIGNPSFSFMTEGEIRNDYICYLTYTNAETHKLLLDNLDRSPMYNGSISGIGPRYCPSIETKVVRFADKERHQVFVEPEGADTDELYLQGLSTSMPYDIQEKMVHSVKGLEHAQITRYGYAIEYDCLNPLELLPTLAIKKVKGLFSAGQINGSSGYEEAAAQGLVAGVNAARYLHGQDGFILHRDEAYIGVLIDDLVTKGTNEPYRMMTSRAEHRLYLRQDNADIRLTQKGRDIGLVDDARYAKFQKHMADIEDVRKALKETFNPKQVEALCEKDGETIPKSGISAEALLKRSGISAGDVMTLSPTLAGCDLSAMKYVEVELKYEGYLAKAKTAMKDETRLEGIALPADLDYLSMDNLRLEAREKLAAVRPLTVGQASRISGVTPADITVLLLKLKECSKI